MSVWTIIQARTRSRRRPGKVLADFGDGLLIDAVYARAAEIGPDVALTIPDNDPELEKVCMERDWTYCTGPENDVVKRYALAVDLLMADTVVRVTGDCPFVDVEAARWTLDQHLRDPCDLTTFHLAEGRGVQVFSAQGIRSADLRAKGRQRDSPDIVMLDNPFLFSVDFMKFSVDTPEDLEIARRRYGGEHDYQPH